MILQVPILDMILFPFRITYAAVKFTLVGISYVIVGGKKAKQTIDVIKEGLDSKIKCPDGHIQDAYGVWKCNDCGCTRKGHVWDTCTGCHKKYRLVDCRACGLSIINPAAKM